MRNPNALPDSPRRPGDCAARLIPPAVDATATFERGRPYHTTEGEPSTRNHFEVTPYHFTLVIHGPGAPPQLNCTFFQVRHKLQMPNPLG